jgi:hypothetical protein
MQPTQLVGSCGDMITSILPSEPMQVLSEKASDDPNAQPAAQRP